MSFIIVRQDITKMKVDAIVNAANPQLLMGGGVCGAIFRAAGPQQMQAACTPLAPIKTGEAVITPGFALPAKYVVHTAGPVYSPKRGGENARLLASSYTQSLQRALESGCESIAFPLISSGIYGYPKREAFQVASQAIRRFLEKHEMTVYLTVFDKASLLFGEKLLTGVDSYLEDHYERENMLQEKYSFSGNENILPEESSAAGLEDMIDRMDEPFNVTLLRLIDDKGKTDVEVYKKANIDRKLFSKIRKGNGYMPGKRTILALAVALELTLEETQSLLEKAGYTLSNSRKADVIVEYFIINGRYDIFEINEALFAYDQPLLGTG